MLRSLALSRSRLARRVSGLYQPAFAGIVSAHSQRPALRECGPHPITACRMRVSYDIVDTTVIIRRDIAPSCHTRISSMPACVCSTCSPRTHSHPRPHATPAYGGIGTPLCGRGVGESGEPPSLPPTPSRPLSLPSPHSAPTMWYATFCPYARRVGGVWISWAGGLRSGAKGSKIPRRKARRVRYERYARAECGQCGPWGGARAAGRGE